jgi:hypothetical protein
MVEVIAIEFEGLSAVPAGGAPARDRRPFCVVAARGHGDMETFTRRPPETPKIAVLSNARTGVNARSVCRPAQRPPPVSPPSACVNAGMFRTIRARLAEPGYAEEVYGTPSNLRTV